MRFQRAINHENVIIGSRVIAMSRGATLRFFHFFKRIGHFWRLNDYKTSIYVSKNIFSWQPCEIWAKTNDFRFFIHRNRLKIKQVRLTESVALQLKVNFNNFLQTFLNKKILLQNLWYQPKTSTLLKLSGAPSTK